jgi:DNA-binding NarL/FixJ family response regulator
MREDDRAIRLLIADEQPVFREGMRAVLIREGTAQVVGEAEDFEQAASQAEQCRPEVVVASETLPGEGAVRLLRLLQPSQAARVLIVGNDDGHDTPAEWVRAGAAGYLSRRATPAEVGKAVICAARGERWVSRRAASIALEQLLAASEAPPHKELLTPREREIIRLVARGCRNSEVAAALYISEKTVKTHLSSIFRKLGARDRVQAAVAAIRAGLADGVGARR